jgi:hypothetical protein
MGWSIADVFVGGVIYTLSAWVIWIGVLFGFPSACIYDNRKFMKKSINDNRKIRGRPATGTAPLVGVRMTPEFQKPIRAWAKAQDDGPSMAEAIRRLVELGLKAKR